MTRVDVRPSHYRWARGRARVTVPELAKRFPKLEEWEAGASSPTLKQLEGQTLYRDAFRMLGFSKMETFQSFGHSLGIPT